MSFHDPLVRAHFEKTINEIAEKTGYVLHEPAARYTPLTIVLVSIAVIFFVLIPVGLCIFLNFVANEDEEDDVRDTPLFRQYLNVYQRCRRFLQAPGGQGRARLNSRREERVPLQQTEMSDCRQRRTS